MSKQVFFGRELVDAIEAEIKFEYIGGAINWANATYDNAWEKAMLEFDRALTLAIEREDYANLKIAGDKYKHAVLALVRQYKAIHKIDDAEAFLRSVSP